MQDIPTYGKVLCTLCLHHISRMMNHIISQNILSHSVKYSLSNGETLSGMAIDSTGRVNYSVKLKQDRLFGKVQLYLKILAAQVTDPVLTVGVDDNLVFMSFENIGHQSIEHRRYEDG